MYCGSGSGPDERSIISTFLSQVSFHFALPPLSPRAGVARRWLAISVMMRFNLRPGSCLRTRTHTHADVSLSCVSVFVGGVCGGGAVVTHSLLC